MIHDSMHAEYQRQFAELRAKLASRDAEVERLVDRVTRLERKEASRVNTVNCDREACKRGDHSEPCQHAPCKLGESIIEGMDRQNRHAAIRELIRRRT